MSKTGAGYEGHGSPDKGAAGREKTAKRKGRITDTPPHGSGVADSIRRRDVARATFRAPELLKALGLPERIAEGADGVVEDELRNAVVASCGVDPRQRGQPVNVVDPLALFPPTPVAAVANAGQHRGERRDLRPAAQPNRHDREHRLKVPVKDVYLHSQPCAVSCARRFYF